MKRVLRLRRESQGFAIGSLLFALGALPGYALLVREEADGFTYAIGAVFFTLAAFIQLRLSGRWRPGAWKNKADWDDWWSAAIQFIGTLCFNVSTIAALVQTFDTPQVNQYVWRPDVYGSICFLISSVLAIFATTHTEGLWDPDARNWWSTWLNMAGSIAFMASAIAAYVVPSSGEVANATVVNLGTFLGAICFLVAALLVEPPKPKQEPAPGMESPAHVR